MTSLLPAFLADISFVPLIPIVAIIGGMLIAAIAIIGGLLASSRRQQMWHETARIALEKGQPLPALPEDEQNEPKRRDRADDIRTGLILIAVGGALYLFLSALVGRALGYVGAIPGFIGVALLLFGLLNLVFKRNDPPPPDRT